MTSSRWSSTPLAALVVAVSLVACARSGEPTPDTASTPEAAGSAATVAPTTPEDVWARIQSGGDLVVGTSADYPPFESYDANHELTGFDVALMEAVAAKLGVGLDWRDIAFDGLAGALVVGQVDVAIGAISATAEREALVDFSHIYFVGQDAYLAARDSGIGTIAAVGDLARYRVGVQQGSVFEQLLEQDLVETGLMDPHSLFLYINIEDGLVDLAEGRVDLVVLDRQPARLAATGGGFTVVAEGLHDEQYAIAMAKGQNDLRTKVNQALLALRDDGTMASLEAAYLDLEDAEVAPVPTPEPAPPTSEPLPPPTGNACIDGMAWVQDLTYDDAHMTRPAEMGPGESFRKGWLVRNTGTCTWNDTYWLSFADGVPSGAQMGARPVAIQGEVTPGATYDLYVDLVAPIRPNVYLATFEMRNGESQAFGERVSVGVRVAAGATATPAPTQTPSAGIEFTADRTRIDEGECTNVRWNVNNIRAVYFYREGQSWEDHGVTGQGSHEVCRDRTTTYFLRVVKLDGSDETRSIAIDVEQSAKAPNVDRFDVDPSGQIAVGQCVALYWDVSGPVDRVNVLRNGGAIWNSAPQRGRYQDCPPGTGDVTYELEAVGPGGRSRATLHVNVFRNAPTPPPAPTGVPDPVIEGFSVSPGQILANQCVNISWSTSGDAMRVVLLRDGSAILDDAGTSGSERDCIDQPGTVRYQLSVSNREGKTVTSDATLDVVGQPPAADQATEAPAPEPPRISGFSASPPQLEVGNACVSLSWSVGGSDLAAIRLFRNDDEIASDPSAPFQDCVGDDLAGTIVRYRLRLDSEFAGSDEATLDVPFGQG